MDLLQIGLRIVHIFSGVAWVGAAALFFFYLEPTMNKLGPDAEKFVDELMNRRRLPIYFVVSSTLSVLSGLVLYWRDSNGLQPAWIISATGLAFTIGGVAAIAAWAGGNLLIPSAIKRMMAIGGQMKAAGGPPTAEMMGAMHAAQQRLRLIGLVDLVLLGVALLGMAVARYLR